VTFEVQPIQVGAGHWRLAIVLVAVLALAIVGVGVVSRPHVSAARGASVDARELAVLRLPSGLDCHDLARPDCESAIRTALLLLEPTDGAVVEAGAWKSLLCSNSLDCPPTLLAASSPVGSVVLRFASGDDAWINVMARPEPTPAGPVVTPFAWFVRWR
jgi:hypothetical protein